MPLHNVDWESIEWTEIRAGVSRKTFSGERATLALHRLMPGHEPRPHSHHYEQVAYILSGEVDFHVGEEVVRLKGGGVIAIPPNETHYAVVMGDEPALNLDVFIPRRPEYD